MTPPQRKQRRLSPVELQYHERLVERAKWAHQAQQEIAAINAAYTSWAEHLHAKYGLGPGDGVDEAGKIVRAPSASSQTPPG